MQANPVATSTLKFAPAPRWVTANEVRPITPSVRMSASSSARASRAEYESAASPPPACISSGCFKVTTVSSEPHGAVVDDSLGSGGGVRADVTQVLETGLELPPGVR